MRSRLSRFRAPAAAVAATALVLLGPGAASAGENSGPVDDLVGSVKDGLASPGQAGATPPGSGDGTDTDPDAPTDTTLSTPSSDDDQAGHETEDPAAPDHGGSEVVDLDVDGEDVLDVGHNDSTVQDDDSTTADSTLLAFGGQEVIGAHADSDGQQEEHFGDPLAPLCEESDGQLCLRLLYADAEATDDGNTSSSRSSSGVLDACVGGDSANPEAGCTGPVDAGVMQSSSDSERNQSNGRTKASSESTVAGGCLEDDPATPGCAAGGDAAHSQGHSRSGGSQAAAGRDSYVLAGDLGGEEQGRVGDPATESFPLPGCPPNESLVCVFVNQGETYVGDKVAGHAQQALELTLLPGILDINLGLGHTETLVHNDVSLSSSGERPNLGSGGPGAPGAGVGDVAESGGVLPNTGGVWSGLLAAGLLMTAAGAFFVAFSRRRVVGLA